MATPYEELATNAAKRFQDRLKAVRDSGVTGNNAAAQTLRSLIPLNLNELAGWVPSEDDQKVWNREAKKELLRGLKADDVLLIEAFRALLANLLVTEARKNDLQ